MDLSLAVAAVAGYLLGSIPFGLLLTRFAGLGDVRDIGSGNIGATNVLRTGNKGLAAATLLFDALKGTAGVLVAGLLSGETLAPLAGGIGAFLGHIFPVWLGFKGGKGVATYIGVLLGWAWPIAGAFCAAWLLVAAVSRYSSLAALIASVGAPVYAWVISGSASMGMAAAAMSGLLIWKHAANMKRLMSGEEPKIGA